MNAAVIYWKHIKHLTNLEFEGIIPEIGIIETEYALVWKGAMEDDTQPEDLSASSMTLTQIFPIR